jgi:hypothetical protein
MTYVKIKERDHLYRDIDTRALLNTDEEEFKTYYAERDLRIKQMQEKQSLENKVDKLEQDMSDIKNLLQQLVNTKA